ncbi:hypothetical protein [Streptomyces sp. NPDC093109]|uniref:hypothetical protein n=1 Tax=Streptomyces sp. NPDC093109 TaxID=3154977 RepID=UPI00344C90A8
MYERKKPKPALPIRPSPGTYSSTMGPREVEVGDYVRLDGEHHRVADMRAGHSGDKILLFESRPPWRMGRAMTVYRPITRVTADP